MFFIFQTMERKSIKKKHFEKKPPKVTKMLGRRMNTGAEDSDLCLSIGHLEVT